MQARSLPRLLVRRVREVLGGRSNVKVKVALRPERQTAVADKQPSKLNSVIVLSVSKMPIKLPFEWTETETEVRVAVAVGPLVPRKAMDVFGAMPPVFMQRSPGSQSRIQFAPSPGVLPPAAASVTCSVYSRRKAWQSPNSHSKRCLRENQRAAVLYSNRPFWGRGRGAWRGQRPIAAGKSIRLPRRRHMTSAAALPRCRDCHHHPGRGFVCAAQARATAVGPPVRGGHSGGAGRSPRRRR